MGTSESPFRVHIQGERPTAPPTIHVKDRGPRPVGSPRLAEPRPGSPSAAFREPRGNREVEAQRELRPEVSRAQARTGTKYIQKKSSTEQKKRNGQIKIAQQKCGHQAKTTRTRVSTKIQAGYLKSRRRMQTGLRAHTPHGQEEKAATLQSRGSASGNVRGGRSQVPTRLVQLADAFSHVQVPLSF